MVCIWNKQQIIKSSLHARCLSELAPAIQQNSHFGQPCIFRRHLVQMSFSKSKVGLFSVKIFKAILHSLYPFIILSNTGNIDSSLPSVDSPIAGNKRQNSHWHRMSVQFLQLQWREKISVIVNSLYSSRVGSWHSLLHCRTSASAKLENLCLFQALLFFLSWMSVRTQASCTHAVLRRTAHSAWWPRGLPGFMECQFSNVLWEFLWLDTSHTISVCRVWWTPQCGIAW